MKNLLKALATSLLALLLSVSQAFAVDIPVESYVTGGLTLTLNGDWSTSLDMGIIKRINGFEENETSSWDSVDGEDYITFADDTTTAGFYLTVDLTDFAYTGYSQTQGALSASNFTLYGDYANGTASAATKGYDDPTKNLSILPASCANALTTAFTFHSNFNNSVTNYSLPGSTSVQTLITSTVDCLAIGHLRFDRVEFLVPSTADNGDYSSTITITMIDGTP